MGIIEDSYKGRASVVGYTGRPSAVSKAYISPISTNPIKSTISLGFLDAAFHVIRTPHAFLKSVVSAPAGGKIPIYLVETEQVVVGLLPGFAKGYAYRLANIAKFDPYQPGKRVSAEVLMPLFYAMAEQYGEVKNLLQNCGKKLEIAGSIGESDPEGFLLSDYAYWYGKAHFPVDHLEFFSEQQLRDVVANATDTVNIVGGYTPHWLANTPSQSPKKTAAAPVVAKLRVTPAGTEEQEVVDYLQENRIRPATIDRVLTYRRSYGIEIMDPNEGLLQKGRFKVPVDPFKNYLQAALDRLLDDGHVWLVGPKASGKNELLSTISWLFQLPVFTLHGSSDLDKADVLGDKTLELLPDGKQKVVHEAGVVVQSLLAGRAILNVDEMNSLRPELTMLLHPLGDKRRALNVPRYGFVEAKPGWMMIGTMNHGYAGTGDLNEALGSRGMIIDMEPEVSVKELLDQEVPGCSGPTKAKLVDLFEKYVKAVKAGQLPMEIINLRGLVEAAKAISHPEDPEDPLFAVYYNLVTSLYAYPEEKAAALDLAKTTLGGGKSTGSSTLPF